MDEKVSREEYQRGMERLHERLDGIAGNVSKVEASAGKIEIAVQYMAKSIEQIHEAVFGNGKPGALQRITQVWTKITVQWWLIGTAFCCMGAMITVFITHLSK